MKDFYDFLNQQYNFLGFLILVSIVSGGLVGIVNAATRNWGKNTSKSKSKNKQQLND